MDGEDYIDELDNEEDNEMKENQENNKIEANWTTILHFLKEKQREHEMREAEWMVERQNLIREKMTLESQNRALENSNIDCLRRIKMLEYALRQERIKYARAANGLEGKLNILEDQKDMSKVENLPERPIIQRAQGHQSILVKFLEEIGFEDVFSTADVADIKDLFTKATSSLSKNQELLKTVSRIEEEVKRKIFQEENKKETLEEQFKQIRGSDHQKNPSDGKDSEASGERSNDAENQEEVLSDASFDSVQRDDQSSTIIEADYANKMSPINLKHEFNVHLDSVRGVQFVGSLDCMASVSEDCTVKLWDVKLMHKNMEDGFGEGIEFKGDPYYTLRGHTGPLFRVTGSKINDQIQ